MSVLDYGSFGRWGWRYNICVVPVRFMGLRIYKRYYKRDADMNDNNVRTPDTDHTGIWTLPHVQVLVTWFWLRGSGGKLKPCPHLPWAPFCSANIKLTNIESCFHRNFTTLLLQSGPFTRVSQLNRTGLLSALVFTFKIQEDNAIDIDVYGCISSVY